ncbi:MAG: zf-HC2 domain-containing protein [Planctomycetia bacterium]|nr:zf-HC2 domain-containing protein [Planctomycetia bacterium]
MSTEHCTRLDDYLNGDLREAERSAFETHLGACEVCRRAVAVDRHWEGLLAAAKPIAPATLTEPIAIVAQRERLRRRTILRGWAVIGIAAGLLVMAFNFFDQKAALVVQPDVEVAPVRVAAVPAPPEVRIEFAAESRVIAMPLKSKNPQVSIVWLYPELRVADQAQESEAN